MNQQGESKGPGNRSKVWNEAVVHKACSDLVEAEITPTVLSVRKHLDITQGSDSTVQKYIRTYRELQESDVAGTPPAPEPLMNALGSLWEQALSIATAQCEEQAHRNERDRQALHEESLAIEIRLDEMEAAAKELVAENDRYQQEITELTGTLQGQTGAITSLTEDMHALNNDLALSRSKVENEREQADKLSAHISSLEKQLANANETIGRMHSMAQELTDARVTNIMQSLKSELDDETFKKISIKPNLSS